VVAGGGAGRLSCGPIQFRHAICQAVPEQREVRTAERVGGDEIATGIAVGAVDGSDIVRALDIPEHSASATGQAASQQLGAHGTITAEASPGQLIKQGISLHGWHGCNPVMRQNANLAPMKAWNHQRIIPDYKTLRVLRG
jgi:hypothetical protein